ncbi:hypothetical protein QN239_29685 [Mycolicibacterium sp. Y3]
MSNRSVRTRRVLRQSIGQVLALVLAAAPSLISLPVTLRAAASAVLVVLTGSALVRVLLAEPRAVRSRASRDLPLSGDPAIRWPLTGVLGAAGLLATVLVLAAVGLPLNERSIGAGVCALGALAVGAAWLLRRDRCGNQAHEGGGQLPMRRLVRTGTSVLAAVAVIGGGFAGALAIQPKESATYTSLTFADISWLTAQDQPVNAGGLVRIPWEMNAFGYQPDVAMTAVTIRIDGAETSGIALDIATPVSSADSVDVLGAVTFRAPIEPGRHLVDVIVHPYTRDSLQEREQVMISGFLKVIQT